MREFTNFSISVSKAEFELWERIRVNNGLTRSEFYRQMVREGLRSEQRRGALKGTINGAL